MTLEELLARADDLLRDHPPESTDPKVFLRAQYDAGLAWVHFPRGYGGSDASIDLQPAIDDRLAEAKAPPNGRMFNAIGAGQCAATVLLYGSDAQKQHYLPKVFTGDAEWCQLFSEPGSGSDLASLATRAVPDGDQWIVNGQKVWTSGAQRARYALLLARTDPDAEKHTGLTAFAIDMHAPGVEVRPLRQMNGGADFSEVFFGDARVPDAERLGDVGAGWAVAHSTLAQERYNMPRIPARGSGPIAVAVAAWQARADKTSAGALALRDRVMQHWVEAEALRLLQARAATLRALGGSGPEGSLGKLATSVVGRRLAEFMPALIGPDAMLIDGYDDVPSMMRRDGPRNGRYVIQRSVVGSPAMSIAGGTDQIQRNIIGDRVLGLPREPAVDRGVAWSQTLRN
ncbi:MAG TPA: acyl-CoA dehydrogenase family protein [Acidimicrobiia bacterium]|nr:acyl-CoA dehydrogenase family protein [Acidimicrobiia bacterium]